LLGVKFDDDSWEAAGYRITVLPRAFAGQSACFCSGPFEPTKKLSLGASCNNLAAKVMQESKEDCFTACEPGKAMGYYRSTRAIINARFSPLHYGQHFLGDRGQRVNNNIT
jgi:hypothetical protein